VRELSALVVRDPGRLLDEEVLLAIQHLQRHLEHVLGRHDRIHGLALHFVEHLSEVGKLLRDAELLRRSRHLLRHEV
jgi:hypothetical protein